MNKKFFVKVFLPAVLMFLVSLSGYSQNLHYERYLNDGDIRCLEKYEHDPYGLLWIGTSNGFYVVHNSIWDEYKNVRQRDGGSIPFSSIKSITPYKGKALVLSNHGIVCFDAINGVSSAPLSYLGNTIVPDIVVGMDSIVFLYSSAFKSAFEFNFLNEEIVLVKTFEDSSYDFSLFSAKPIKNNPGGLYLFGHDMGVLYMNMRKGQFSVLDQIPSDIYAKSCTVDNEGHIWVASRSQGILHYSHNVVTGECTLLHKFDETNSPFQKGSHVAALQTNALKSVIVSTDNSVFVIHLKDGSDPMFEVIDSFLARSAPVVMSLSKFNVLLGTENRGLTNVRKSFLTSITRSSLNTKNIISSNDVYALYDDAPNKLIWIGTAAGIDCMDYDNNVVRLSNIYSSSHIVSIAGYGNDYLLVVSTAKGLMLYNKNTGTYSDYRTESIPQHSLSSAEYSKIRLANKDSNTIAIMNMNSTNYLLNIETGEASRFDFQFSERNEFVTPILVNTQNHALFNSANAIYELEYSTLETRRLYYSQDSIISGITAVSQKPMYFAKGNTIYSLQPSINELKILGQVDLFENVTIKDLKIDGNGLLWVVDDAGQIYSFNLENSHVRIYPAELYNKNNFDSNVSIGSSVGNVYFTGSNGILAVNPNSYVPNDYDSCTFSLLEVNVGDQRIKAGNIPDGRLKVLNNFSALKVKLNVINNNSLCGIKFKYTLSDDNGDIQQVISTNDVFEVTSLSPGSYSLKVSALTTDGWSADNGLLEIRVVRKPMESILAWILYILLIVSAVAGVCVYMIRKSKTVGTNNNPGLIENQDSDAAKIRFITRLAHDIRSPLSLVYNPLRDIRDDSRDNPQLYKKLTRALVQVNKASRLATAAMNVQKLSQTEDMVQLVNINLNEWLATLMLEYNIDCEAKGLQLEFEPESKIQSIKADVTKVEVAVSNMLQNAIQSNQSGVIKVATSFPSQRFIRISVADQGNGFEGDGESMFDVNPNKDAVEGYGIGLAYARKIVTKMNGRLAAEHNADGGTTLVLDIPLLMSYAVNSNSEQHMHQPQQQNANVSVDTKKVTLLIVDDQQDVLDFIKEELEDKFKNILTAHNGIEALVQIDSNKPQFVVSDIMMPQMNGFELCQSLKTNVKISHLPIIALSSKTEAANQISFFKQGPDDFIGKPFDVNHLYSVIVKHLTKRMQIASDYQSGAFKKLTTQHSFSAADDKFIVKLQEVIGTAKNADDVNLSELANVFSLSQKEVSQKIEDLIGVSVKKYLSNYFVE